MVGGERELKQVSGGDLGKKWEVEDQVEVAER